MNKRDFYLDSIGIKRHLAGRKCVRRTAVPGAKRTGRRPLSQGIGREYNFTIGQFQNFISPHEKSDRGFSEPS